jgi:hypothetical protein
MANSQHHTKWGTQKPFPLNSALRQGYSVSLLLFSIVLEFLAITIRQKKEIQLVHIKNAEFKLSQYAR